MNTKLILIRLGIIALVVLICKLAYDKVADDPGMLLVYFIALGAIGGFLVVKFVLPWFGDAVTTALLSSGEEVKPTETMKAAAKLAQGDYQGAIEEHEKSLKQNPAQSFPVGEIAKIHAEKLNDPQTALRVLETHIAAREWPQDDAAFLRFRVIDIHIVQLQDFDTAHVLLERAIADFPNTRHAANAHHKLGEVEKAQYKQMTERRLKAGGNQAS
jgi:tetratricopeptide (TPR) repeat protein